MNNTCIFCLNPTKFCTCEKTKSDGVIYIGPTLPCTGISTNDNMTLTVQKLNDSICSLITTTTSSTSTSTSTTTSTTTITILEFNTTDITVWNNGKNNLDNTSFGETALRSITLGTYNTAFGHWALTSHTTGQFNTAIGDSALYNNTIGGSNTAVGASALTSTTNNANNNTAVGVQAGSSQVTASNNTLIGVQALRANINGNFNTAIGYGAGSLTFNNDDNTNPNSCVYIGFNAVSFSPNSTNEIVIGSSAIGLGSNTVQIGNSSITKFGFYGSLLLQTVPTTGVGTEKMLVRDVSTGEVKQIAIPSGGSTGSLEFNATDLTVWNNGQGNISSVTSFGDQALKLNAGGFNSAFGFQALTLNVGGLRNSAFGHSSLSNNSTGGDNVAFGYQALLGNNTGTTNTAIGGAALFFNNTGNQNTAIGLNALFNCTTSGNTALGYRSGRYITGSINPNTTPTNSVFLGIMAQAQADGQDNQIVIGSLATGLGTNTAMIGNSSQTQLGFYGVLKQKTSYTVATLPAGQLGDRTFVTDALGSPTFGSGVVAGGSTITPVFHNGTSWLYG